MTGEVERHVLLELQGLTDHKTVGIGEEAAIERSESQCHESDLEEDEVLPYHSIRQNATLEGMVTLGLRLSQ